MSRCWSAVSAALLIVPTLVHAQDRSEQTGQKQKAWLVANLRAGPGECAILRQNDGFAVSGTARASFDNGDRDGLDFAIAASPGAAPTVTALAIKTKGTGAQRQRAGDAVCQRAADAKASGGSGSTCAVFGSSISPEIRFIVPFAAFGDVVSAKSFVGTVSIVKRAADAAAVAQFLSKKGYDNYVAHANFAGAGNATPAIEMKVVATCDASGLMAKAGRQDKASYDLAIGKKA